MKAWKIIVAGIVVAIIAQIIHSIEAMATMDFYMDPDYFAVWSKIMMPGPGPPPTEFYYYSIIFGIITGIIYAVIYAMIKKSVPGKTILKQGLYFGFLLFLLGIPHFLSIYLLINLPALLLVYWAITGLIVNLINGVIIAYIVK
ncbi:MAG: hypothetical protein GTN36_03595 [Candidatus Aenigmarchaeota archaeon]|nr:hypothetical protein [Candidatus Aenigmarchaeota archaeon]